MKQLTIVIPYFDQPQMLNLHIKHWGKYSRKFMEAVNIIIVDDCSKHWALNEMYERDSISLFRVLDDIPWNRGGARNLGSYAAQTPWLMHIDIDHLLLPDSAENLLKFLPQLQPDEWYRFKRYRRGPADETRNKDAIPRDAEFGEIKPHIDSYICSRNLYWSAGGYDEDYSGCLGGGSPFLHALGKVGRRKMAPDDVSLVVVTKDICADSSVFTLDRSTDEYTRRKAIKKAAGTTVPVNPIRFRWVKQL